MTTNPSLTLTFPLASIKEFLRRVRLVFSRNHIVELTDKERGHVRYFVSIALREGNGPLRLGYGDELESIYQKTADGAKHPHWQHVRSRRTNDI